jgi:hypothetical protein
MKKPASFLCFLAVLLLVTTSDVFACDFCMLGQGISPYLTANGRGISLDVNYTESDKVYNGTSRISEDQQEEGWLIYSLKGFYSVTERLNVSISVPYAVKTNIDYDQTTQTTPGELVDGVGDVTLAGRYTFFLDHSLTSTLQFGGLFGLKLPTGATHDTDAFGNPVDRHALPGTGSVDYIFGLNGLYTFGGDWQITADVAYDLAGAGDWDGNPHRYGNALNYSTKVFYKILPKEIGEKSLFFFVGVSGDTMGKEVGVLTDSGNYEDGVTNDSTGGTVLMADVGIHAILSSSTLVDFGFSKAFYHDMNFSPDFDTDPAEDHKIDFSITYLF